MKVIKRNGFEVPFDREKIVSAISKAFEELYGAVDDDMLACANKIANEIENTAKGAILLDVEEIQDEVERKLMATRYKTVAKAYTNYRYLHSMARDQYRDLMDSVAEKLSASNIQNQNANVDEMSFGGRIGEMADLVAKKYALEYLVSPMARANHENNEVYIHDLNSYAVGSHNCLSIPFDDLLANGFNTRQTDVRPAQSINTAFQLVAVIFQIQSLQQFGGVSATHLDWTMVPYVRKSFYKHFKDGMLWCESPNAGSGYTYWCKELKDKVYNGSLSIEDGLYDKYPDVRDYARAQTIKEISQAVEGMYHNLNTLMSRSGNQLK